MSSDVCPSDLDSSPEAKGVVPGMPLQEAMSLSKAAVLLRVDASHYESVFTKMIASLCQRSPLVEKGEMGCAYVGLDGLEKMYGGETRLVASVLNAVPHNLNPRVGVAGGKVMSYVAALSRSEEHTSELQSQAYLVCSLLL